MVTAKLAPHAGTQESGDQPTAKVDVSGLEQATEAPRERWVAINAHSHREHIALENLARQDFEAYCPMIQRRVRHARRTREVLRPLFPGYLFVRIDPDLQRWRPILSTYGVRALVRFGERLSYVEDGLVQSLKAREVEGVITIPAEPYRVGQQVRISGGPFDGLAATIIEMDEKDRLVVLMRLLNQSVNVKVAARDVCAL
jgi:transcriptional antiterminator RfaH